MVSENLPIEGVPTTYGTPAWQPHTTQPAAASAPVILRSVAAGATCIGVYVHMRICVCIY